MHPKMLPEATIAAMEEIRKAYAATPATTVEKQEQYVALSAQRCRRCGAKTYTLMPTSDLGFCGECIDWFMEADKRDDDRIMWFSELRKEVMQMKEAVDADRS